MVPSPCLLRKLSLPPEGEGVLPLSLQGRGTGAQRQGEGT